MDLKQPASETSLAAAPLGGVRQVTGSLDARGLRFGLAVSRYHGELTRQLLQAVLAALREHGAADANVTVVWVPGAYEISTALHRLAGLARFDALLGLGVVIQGETPHARLINEQLAHALALIARQNNLPVIDGVIPVESEAQAVARCGSGHGSRGWYLGCAAIEMAHVFRRLDGGTA